MAKHSEQRPAETQVRYVLNATKLRLARFQLIISEEINGSKGAPRVCSFDDGPVRIGKLADDVQVTLSDETVSRRHCEIIREGDYYALIDLESTNGTFVNGVRVKQIYLEPNVTFTIGNTQITFNHAQDEVSIVPTQERQLGKVIGGDVKMREIFSIIKKIASTDTTVIIEGETGTGKDVVAQTIHDTSRRADKPFVVVDCSAIPEHLIESELFGHEKGSFTGAIVARKGLFEQANGGTIFLDELGELSLDLQPKLLRVLESRKIRRVGGSQSTPVNVRVIAATNRHLEEEVSAGRFREDLFYRLSVVRIFLPPLRERISDLPLLIGHFLRTSSFNKSDAHTFKVAQISAVALRSLMMHRWPGNVRELLNVIERACTFAEGQTIQHNDLPPNIQSQTDSEPIQPQLNATLRQTQPFSIKDLDVMSGDRVPQHITKSIPPSLVPPEEETLNQHGSIKRVVQGDDGASADQNDHFESFKSAKERWITLFERDYILTALKRSSYNISHAAREAQIDRKYFRKLMQKYEIEIP